MKQYRLLNDGEIIKQEDEFYHCDRGEWVGMGNSSSVGRKYKEDSYQPFRRLIEPAQPDIPADGEPVIVWQDKGDPWKRYSTGREMGGRILCFGGGATKWTTNGLCELWSNWRRPTKEELA